MVKDRAHLEGRLRLPESALDAPEALVRACDLLRAQRSGGPQDVKDALLKGMLE